MEAKARVNAPKRPVNLSLDSELLRLGKELGLNVSAIAEEALDKAIRACLQEAWLKENEAAIAAYNSRAAARGVFSDGLRTF